MKVILSSAAQHDLRQLSPEIYKRVLAALYSLRDNPRPPGCLLLCNYKPPTWRIRVGDWRILYEIDDSKKLVRIHNVYHRSRSY